MITVQPEHPYCARLVVDASAELVEVSGVLAAKVREGSIGSA